MNQKEEEIYKELLQDYKWQYDQNAYARTNYDEDLEYYRGYRNANDYPLAYNVNFNRILPIIHTLLAKFMDQIYQSGNIVAVKPRHKSDIERAKKVEGILNYQMESLNSIDAQGGSYLTMMKWMFNAITFGKGIVKVYWRKEERISPKRMSIPIPNFDRQGNFQGMDYNDHISQEWQTVYNGPYVEVIHNKLFIPNPEYKDIQQMPRVFIVYRRTIDAIKKMADKGIYKNIKDLGGIGTGYASGSGQAGYTNYLGQDSTEAFIHSLGIEGATSIPDSDEGQDRRSPEVDVLECYGKMILEDEPYEVGSGYKIKGKEEEIIAHIGNYRTLLSLQKNTYGMRPIFDIGCYYHPELYWDLGMVTLTKGVQEQINNLGNLRIQNAMMMINPMLKVNANSDIDPESLIWKPFGIIPTEDPSDVEPLIIPDTNSQLFMEQEMFYKNTIQDIMGQYDYNMGATPQRQERVGVVHGIQQMGEARAKLLLMSMDHLGMRPLLKHMMTLNTFHLPRGYEYREGGKDSEKFGQVWGDDIHSDFDFAARYVAMEPALGKQYRAQQLVQMAQMWKQDPWINQYQYNKVMLELLDIREADYLLKTPKQFAEEMQQKQAAVMKAEQSKQQGDMQGKLAKSVMDAKGKQALQKMKTEAGLMEEVLEGKVKLKEQKLENQGKIAVAAIQAEAVREGHDRSESSQ